MNQKNKEVVVVIPIYKNTFDPYEQTSLDYCKQHLNSHDILIISPQSLSKDQIFLEFIRKEKLNVHFFENRFFDGIDGYNRLMLNLDFYKTFSEYKYMLIYQLDALVFSDDLLHWTKKGYDYIGAPWILEGDVPFFDSLGNGGLSLRKIETFIAVLESRDFFYDSMKYHTLSLRIGIKNIIMIRILHIMNKNNISLNFLKLFLFFYKGYEDYFWSFLAKFFTQKFSLPTIEESLKFGFEVNPSYCFKTNKRNLPFGAHAWYRYDLDFWLTTVEGLKEKLSNNEKMAKND